MFTSGGGKALFGGPSRSQGFASPEPQISIFLIGISLAVLVPVYNQLLHQPKYAPGAALCVGTMLGAAGAFIGSAYASQWPTWPRRLFLSLWTLFALFLATGAGFGVLSTPSWFWRVALALSALLPLAAAGVFWVLKE